MAERLSEVVVIKPKHIGFPAGRVREAFGLPRIDHRRRLAGWLPSGMLAH
jgi:hypothetical protein